MDSRLKVVIAIVITVLVVVPITAKVLRQNQDQGTNPAQEKAANKVPERNSDIAPAANTRTTYTRETAPAFVDDPAVVGQWVSVDFVKGIGEFTPGQRQWKGDLYLKGLAFANGGQTNGPWVWSKGVLWHPGDRSLGKYEIREIAGSKYLFMEWISGDVTMRGQKPKYYVMKRQ